MIKSLLEIYEQMMSFDNKVGILSPAAGEWLNNDAGETTSMVGKYTLREKISIRTTFRLIPLHPAQYAAKYAPYPNKFGEKSLLKKNHKEVVVI
jgi:hypothetical protein